MFTKTPKISPSNAAKYGQIAALLRQKMSEENLSINDVADKLGKIVSPTAVYNWRLAKNAPGPEARKKLAKIFNTRETDWKAKPLETANGKDTNVVIYPPTVFRKTPNTEVCSFIANGDGTCRLRLDVTMTDIEAGAKLFNQLLSSGLIAKRESNEPIPNSHEG